MCEMENEQGYCYANKRTQQGIAGISIDLSEEFMKNKVAEYLRYKVVVIQLL